MKTNKKHFVKSLLIFLVLGPVFGLTAINPENTSIAVIICSDNPIAFRDNPSLTADEVKVYFLRKGKKSWAETNKNILPVDRNKTCPEQALFYSKVLNMDAYNVERYFFEKQYQIGVPPPESFSSDKDIIDFVGDEIGAIGYVNVNSLSTEAKTKVKVVLIINE